jgi:hypothetical protein
MDQEIGEVSPRMSDSKRTMRVNGHRHIWMMTEPIKIFLDDFTRLVSQDALTRHSRLITNPSVPLREYEVRSPVRPENLD